MSLVVCIYSRAAAGEFEIDQSFILSLLYVHVNNLKFNGERLSLVVRIYSRTAAGEFEIDQSFILSLCTRADQSNYFVQQLALFFFLWNGRTHVVQALTAGSKRALQVRRAYERQYLEMALYAMNHRLAQKQQK